jgi:hypothetical protein
MALLWLSAPYSGYMFLRNVETFHHYMVQTPKEGLHQIKNRNENLKPY